MAELGLKQQYSVLFSFSTSGRACCCSTWYPLALDTLGWLSLTHTWCRGPFPPHGFSHSMVLRNWTLYVVTGFWRYQQWKLPGCLKAYAWNWLGVVLTKSTLAGQFRSKQKGLYGCGHLPRWCIGATKEHSTVWTRYYSEGEKGKKTFCFYCLILLAYSFYNAVV